MSISTELRSVLISSSSTNRNLSKKFSMILFALLIIASAPLGVWLSISSVWISYAALILSQALFITGLLSRKLCEEIWYRSLLARQRAQFTRNRIQNRCFLLYLTMRISFKCQSALRSNTFPRSRRSKSKDLKGFRSNQLRLRTNFTPATRRNLETRINSPTPSKTFLITLKSLFSTNGQGTAPLVNPPMWKLRVSPSIEESFLASITLRTSLYKVLIKSDRERNLKLQQGAKYLLKFE